MENGFIQISVIANSEREIYGISWQLFYYFRGVALRTCRTSTDTTFWSVFFWSYFHQFIFDVLESVLTCRLRAVVHCVYVRQFACMSGAARSCPAASLQQCRLTRHSTNARTLAYGTKQTYANKKKNLIQKNYCMGIEHDCVSIFFCLRRCLSLMTDYMQLWLLSAFNHAH